MIGRYRSDLERTEFERPYEALGYAVIEKAIEDYKGLVDEGILVDGEIITDWPKTKAGRPLRVFGWYDYEAKVIELLKFLQTNSVDRLLDSLGSSIDGARIKSSLEKYKPEMQWWKNDEGEME